MNRLTANHFIKVLSADESLSTREVAERVGCGVSTAQRWLCQLRSARKIEADMKPGPKQWLNVHAWRLRRERDDELDRIEANAIKLVRSLGEDPIYAVERSRNSIDLALDAEALLDFLARRSEPQP